MTARVWRGAFLAMASSVMAATPVSAHGLHAHAAGALHPVVHAIPVLAVVVVAGLAYRLIRSRLAR